MREAVWEDLYQPIVCDVCGHNGPDIGRRRLMFSGYSCAHCFLAWYDYGCVTSETIEKQSLQLRSQVDGEVK